MPLLHGPFCCTLCWCTVLATFVESVFLDGSVTYELCGSHVLRCWVFACVRARRCACVSERAFCVYVHVSVCDVKMNLKMNGTTPLEYGAEVIKVNDAHAAYTSGRRGSP